MATLYKHGPLAGIYRAASIPGMRFALFENGTVLRHRGRGSKGWEKTAFNTARLLAGRLGFELDPTPAAAAMTTRARADSHVHEGHKRRRAIERGAR